MSNNTPEKTTTENSTRPWGHYNVLLDTDYCKVKQITVKPNQRLSYQRHEKREEYWTIVKGQATVTLNDKKIALSEGQQIHIPQHANHRIANKSSEPLIFIEKYPKDIPLFFHRFFLKLKLETIIRFLTDSSIY